MSSTPMRPCYEASLMVKFLGERDHAEKFLSGAMLARRLTYFKELEDDPARWDPNDGLRTYRHISSKPAPESPHFSHVGPSRREAVQHLVYALWRSPTPQTRPLT